MTDRKYICLCKAGHQLVTTDSGEAEAFARKHVTCQSQ